MLCLHLWIVIQYETEEIFEIEFQKNYFKGYVPEKRVSNVRCCCQKNNPAQNYQNMNLVKETSCAIIFYPDQIVVPLTLEHLWSITNSCCITPALLIRTFYHSLPFHFQLSSKTALHFYCNKLMHLRSQNLTYIWLI